MLHNIQNDFSIEDNYANGLLPQRNQKDVWYQESSSRSNLLSIRLSSENRRIINKTNAFSYQTLPLPQQVPLPLFRWVKELSWEFPNNSIKVVFSKHIFNTLYIWSNEHQENVAYSVCYFGQNISHIAYVFYNPRYSHHELPIRLVLQAIIDSSNVNLKYCYLGRFDPISKIGYYKRTMPGFEYYKDNSWLAYNNNK